MQYETYRLCRNKKKIKTLKNRDALYKLPLTKYATGIDLFSFFNEIIANCDSDYALVCHDDVILPQDIGEKVQECIESIDKYVGSENWAIVGNAGIEVLSKRVLTYISDPHMATIPPKTNHPRIVESVDGNTMLLNIKNIKAKNITLPKDLRGFHLYDLILCLEAYKGGLVCAVSSKLFVKHCSAGNYQSFIDASQDITHQKYFSSNFSNHIVTSINGEIPITQNYENLLPDKPKKESVENCIWDTVNKVFNKRKIDLNILVRIHIPSEKIYRLLESILILSKIMPKEIALHIHLGVNNVERGKIEPFIKNLEKYFKELDISSVYIKEKKGYPRVNALRELVFSIPEKKDSFVWFIDYDDFVFPKITEYLQFILADSDIIIGESVAFDEIFDDKSQKPVSSIFKLKFEHKRSDLIYTGNVSVPICSCIYRLDIIRNTLKNSKLIGDYYEDYAILLLASQLGNIQSYPILFSGISYHGKNTVMEVDRTHWDYSYVSFISEVIDNQLMSQNYHTFSNSLLREMGELRRTKYEFNSFKAGLIWKILEKYRIFKRFFKHKKVHK